MLQILIISASGNLKELAHFFYRISFTMSMNDCIFEVWLHLLPTDCRKSRSSSFSIFKRLISYACSLMISSALAGSAFFRGRPFFFGRIPASLRSCSLLCRLIQLLICTFSSPRASAISFLVFPAARIAIISDSNTLILVYFLDLAKPPRVVICTPNTGHPVWGYFYAIQL